MTALDVEPTPLPTDYVCPDGTVPGWLNADGLPTSCIGDLPLVDPLPDRTPGPSPFPLLTPPPADPSATLPPELGTPQDVVRELAATGLADEPAWFLLALVVAALAIAVGVTLRGFLR